MLLQGQTGLLSNEFEDSLSYILSQKPSTKDKVLEAGEWEALCLLIFQ